MCRRSGAAYALSALLLHVFPRARISNIACQYFVGNMACQYFVGKLVLEWGKLVTSLHGKCFSWHHVMEKIPTSPSWFVGKLVWG
jgi:hypothetical protein